MNIPRHCCKAPAASSAVLQDSIAGSSLARHLPRAPTPCACTNDRLYDCVCAIVRLCMRNCTTVYAQLYDCVCAIVQSPSMQLAALAGCVVVAVVGGPAKAAAAAALGARHVIDYSREVCGLWVCVGGKGGKHGRTVYGVTG